MRLFDLTGRVALVTGGNGGIGLAIAEALGEAGAAVAIVGRNSDKNARAVAQLGERGIRAHAIVADVTQPEACTAMVAETVAVLGGLDILVCNAGVNIRKLPQEYSLEEWRLILETNLASVWFSCLAAYPELKRRGGGKIITIGSMMSIFGASFAAPYAASKGGLLQLSRALAIAWARDNIQVNIILPGWIDTELTRQARREVPGLAERVLQRTPVGRWGVPADVAGTAVFLAAPAADFVTGAAIPVDGGYSVQG